MSRTEPTAEPLSNCVMLAVFVDVSSAGEFRKKCSDGFTMLLVPFVEWLWPSPSAIRGGILKAME